MKYNRDLPSALSALWAWTTPSQCHMGDFVTLPILHIGISKYIAPFQKDPALETEHNETSLSKHHHTKVVRGL